MGHRSRVSPDRCAFAVAFPLSEAELADDLRRGGERDFVRSILRRNQGLAEEGLWSLYGPIAATVSRVVSEVEEMGVRVRRRCTMGDLAALLRDCEVVTLAAHCHLLAFTAADILDPPGFVQGVRRQPVRGPADQEVRQTVLAALAAPAPLPGGDRAAAVAAALNRVVERAHDWYEGEAAMPPTTPADDAADQDPARRLTRAELEYRYPSLLVAGRCIELRDGLHAIPELAQAVAAGSTSIFDLSLCNSAILERALKAARRSCMLVINEGPAAIEARMIRYKLMIGVLAHAPARYLDVLSEVHLRMGGLHR